MTKVGYARVSSVGQKLDIQLQKLQEAGCTKIYKEKVSAKSNNRPELDRCLDYIREDDVLVITKLDRLARSLSHLMKIVEILKEKVLDPIKGSLRIIALQHSFIVLDNEYSVKFSLSNTTSSSSVHCSCPLQVY